MVGDSAPPRRIRVATIGGGHGQSAVLRALVMLDCDITAVTSVADDGGCSGRLRAEFGMPPPGDLRRCLTTLATNRALATRFETRMAVGDTWRSLGNLALLEAYARAGSLQAAADWAGSLLRCRGRVTPASEHPGRLAIFDRAAGVLVGESHIADQSQAPMVVAVHDAEHANPEALAAIEAADFVFIGPGSFITSTLAALMTGDIGGALVRTSARRVFVHNLVPEGGQTRAFELSDYVRLLRDHLCIATGVSSVAFDVLRHGVSATGPEDAVFTVPLAHPDEPTRHDPERVAAALHAIYDIPRRRFVEDGPPPSVARRTFDEHLASAMKRMNIEATSTA